MIYFTHHSESFVSGMNHILNYFNIESYLYHEEIKRISETLEKFYFHESDTAAIGKS